MKPIDKKYLVITIGLIASFLAGLGIGIITQEKNEPKASSTTLDFTNYMEEVEGPLATGQLHLTYREYDLLCKIINSFNINIPNIQQAIIIDRRPEGYFMLKEVVLLLLEHLKLDLSYIPKSSKRAVLIKQTPPEEVKP